MARVSKSKAEDIAKALTAKHVQEKKELNKNLSEEIVKAYLKTVPKDVMKLHQSRPGWLSTSRSVRFRDRGFNHKLVNLHESVPCGSSHSINSDVFKDEEVASFLKLQNKIDDKEKEIKELRLEIKSAILALGTEKRVRDNFPEAGKYLDPDSALLPAVNIDALRKRLS